MQRNPKLGKETISGVFWLVPPVPWLLLRPLLRLAVDLGCRRQGAVQPRDGIGDLHGVEPHTKESKNGEIAYQSQGVGCALNWQQTNKSGAIVQITHMSNLSRIFDNFQ